MEVRAVAKYIRVQPRKVRIVADEIRGSEAVLAAAKLRFHPSKGAKALHKVLVSAMANAQENHGVGPDQLRIATITVDEGPRLKRMQARAMGRGNRILKKTSHITVVVEDFEATRPTSTANNTKAKPRPTFAKKKSAPVAAVAVTEPVVEPVAEPIAADTEVTETVATEPVAETTEAPADVPTKPEGEEN
ncbi:MAG: 50S ribosomal protein L22 [Fimbriimonadaceae bacterium]|nr:50S ribosomal protein L22 [Fimbriimonadaceae bacterium]